MSDTREKILDSMYHLVATEGYNKASIGKISEMVGIKKPSVYYFFKNKEEILLELIDSYIHIIKGDLEKLNTVKTKKEYKEFLLKYGKDLIQFYSEDPNYAKFQAEVIIQADRIESVGEKLREYEFEDKKTYEAFIRRGIDLSIFHEDNFSRNLDLLIIICDGIENNIQFKKNANCELAWNSFVDILVNPC